VRRNRTLGDQAEAERPAPGGRAHDALPLPPSAREEAILIAERLAALVESRREQSRATNTGTGGRRPEPAVSRRTADASAPGAVVGARHSGRLLGNLLVTRGFIVDSELNFALARQASTGDPIGRILVDLGLITERDLIELLAEQLRMQVVDLSRVDCDPSLLALLPAVEARRRAALPLRRVHGHIDVAIAEPTDDAAVRALMTILGAPLRLLLATRADIDAAVDRFYR
jgi:hypothetical protein